MPQPTLVVTSNPFGRSSGIDDRIHLTYLNCFRAIHAKSRINIAMYMWSDDASPDVEANPRRLNDSLLSNPELDPAQLHVLFDVDYLTVDAATQFANRFRNIGASADFPVFKKPEQGIDGKPKVRSKTLLFSELRFANDPAVLTELAGQTVHHVVVQSSANIWPTQYSQANQLLFHHGNEVIYKYNLDLWNSVRSDFKPSAPGRFSRHEPASRLSDAIKVYAFPREGNLIENVLGNIFEHQGGERGRIRIAMGDFSNVHSAEVLANIADSTDISVKVIARTPN